MLTAAEVAVILGLKPRTVYDLHASGALTGYRFGRAVRFEPQDVERYRASCRSHGTNETSAGVTSSTVTSKAVVTELLSCFQKAGVKPKLTRSTGRKARDSTPLELAYNGPTR